MSAARAPRSGLGLALASAAALAPLGLVGCRDGVRAGAPALAVVRGTTLDGESGEPLVGVVVEGPRASRAVSDLQGRFVLRGPRVGDEGRLVASRAPSSAGPRRYGELHLRPLRAEGLEVVFHLDPLPAEPSPERGPDSPSRSR